MATPLRRITKSPDQTQNLGCLIGSLLRSGDIVALFGDLGSGKTCLVQGIAKALQVKDGTVNSPTFTLINEYPGKETIYHIDLYRIRRSGELVDLGLEEYLYGNGICLIEWADRIGSILEKDFLRVEIFWEGEKGRRFEISGESERYEKLVEELQRCEF